MKERYESYKDSGVAWIGQVPQGWEVRRLKYLADPTDANSFVDGDWIESPDISDHGIRYLTTGNIGDGVFKRQGNGYVTKETFDALKCKYAYPDDLVLSRLNEPFGRSCLLPDDFNEYVIAVDNVILRTKQHKRYICYVTQCKAYQSAVGDFARGSTMRRISRTNLGNIPIPLPPLPEQRAIAGYLDARCAAIDAYVASLERDAALARELKQAVIARAVTRGLDPNTPMRDSGIPWIGQVPKGWEVRRAKFMFKKNKRPVRPEDEVITCFRDGQVTLRKNRRTEGFTESLTEFGYQGVRKGDLVIHQMDAFAGSIGVSDTDGKGTSVYHCCTPKGDYDTKYYAYLIRQMAYSGFIQSLYRGIRERSSDFSFNVFGNQYLVIPPLPEQRAIAGYLDARCAAIEAYVASLEREAALARELKAREIADAVTGKVKITA